MSHPTAAGGRSPATQAAAANGAPLHLVLPFCLAWSSAFAAGKVSLLDSPPLLLLALRFLIAGAILTAVAALRGEHRGLDGRTLAVLVLLGVLNHALYLGLSYSGMTMVSSGLAALVISANPVLVAAAAAVLLGEAMSWRKAAGLALGVAGVALVVRGRLGAGLDAPAGIALVVGALGALVAGTLLFKRLAPKAGLIAGTGVQVLSAGLLLLPVALAVEDAGALRLTGRLAASLAFQVLVVSIGAYLLWFRLLERSSATEASAFHFLMPPLGLLFGWAILDEAVQPWDMLGLLPVVLGIRLVTQAGPPAPPMVRACAR